VARKLNKMGYEATALEGGFEAWKAEHPVVNYELGISS
jgi:rhodanese-related sulfurtransferase